MAAQRRYWKVSNEVYKACMPSYAEFKWECGMSDTVYKRNVVSLHNAIKKNG